MAAPRTSPGISTALVKGGKVRGAARPTLFTKWCPTPGEMTPETVRAAVLRALTRMQAGRIDLLQFHWWTFEHPAWLEDAELHEMQAMKEEGLIGALGLTNFDAAHLNLASCRRRHPDRQQPGVLLTDRSAGGR